MGYSEQEETPMTLQIGLRGADGWLIASDRCEVPESVASGDVAIQQSVQKIEIDDKKGLAFAAWGFKEVKNVGRTIIERFDPALHIGGILKRELERIADAEWEKHKHIASWRNPLGLIIGIRGVPMPLWTVSVAEHSNAIAYYPASGPIVGHIGNAALFFLRHYFKRGLPVERLQMLAAHVVLTASKINPEGVNGLDMAICKGDTLFMLSDEKIESLEQRSAKIDGDIARLLGLPNPS